jgi:peptidoglycan/xylan/chitin deacetylase (PgdA/CDA1 family)
MGSVVISIDAELGWGFCDYEQPPPSRVAAGRAGWRTLLDLLGAHDLPATWAVVGHLFLDDCDGVHPELPSVEGWFDRERTAWLRRPELRFGRDLVAATAGSPVGHELACHSFSHVLFDDARVTREIARAEIEVAVEAARSFGVEFDSFVFPRNRIGHRDLLAAHGFRCYRGLRSRPGGRLRRAGGKVLSAIDPGRVDLVAPRVDEYGLVEVPASLFLFGFEGWPRRLAASLGTDPVVRQAEHAIDRASREDGLFHLWLHPNNLRTARDVERVRAVLAHLAARRERTDLTVETMAEVAERVA